ncbi:hypothetical protein CL673_07330 [Candidatus Bathyarchaeota archaeon]|jgi:hypothetical protein|nr:hypothetical protein [Candidatus Bathyarchaeota archaeon]|tara:strand:- start:264 stop:506 length:243 start_codon:yes stop_codon:yes gene_type:complete
MSDFYDDIERRALEDEKITLQNRARFQEKKTQWLTTICPGCSRKVEYALKEGVVFDGNLKCGHCGKSFHLSRLSDFMGEK